MQETDMQETVPKISPRLLAPFHRYNRWYLGRHFHALRLSRAGRPPAALLAGPTAPLVIYLNHPSWWDPLVALALSDRLFGAYRSYGPIEAQAVERYGFFRRLGFFGVDRGTAAGARRFLRTSLALLERPATALWITPEGQFRDPRERPVELESGLAHLARHLARRLGHGLFLPLALEYPFWEESSPEVLARFGEPVSIVDLDGGPAQITAALAAHLEATQDALASEARARRPEAFESLLAGRAGVGGVYDLWRAFKARLRGERFDREHRRTTETENERSA